MTERSRSPRINRDVTGGRNQFQFTGAPTNMTSRSRRRFGVLIASSLLSANLGICQSSKAVLPDRGAPVVSWDKDDLLVSGDLWSPQDPNEKPMQFDTAIRCRKKLGLCALANNPQGRMRTYFLPITAWTPSRVTIRGEIPRGTCETNEYVIDLFRSSVLQIFSPGAGARFSGCRQAVTFPGGGWPGNPRKVVFELSKSPTER